MLSTPGEAGEAMEMTLTNCTLRFIKKGERWGKSRPSVFPASKRGYDAAEEVIQDRRSDAALGPLAPDPPQLHDDGTYPGDAMDRRRSSAL